MAPQTRIGFVVLILLVGCLLAIPHFRHPLGSSAETPEASASTAPSTKLQLKADPVTARKKAARVTSAIPASRGLASQRSLNSSSTPLRSSQASPSPPGEREQWKFPPVAKLQEPQHVIPGSDHALAGPPSPPHRDVVAARPRPLRLPQEAMASLPSGQRDLHGRSQNSSLPANGSPPNGWANDTRRSDPGSTTARPSQTASVGSSQLVRRQAVRTAETAPALHRIVNGDTLENLARQYYGDPRKAMLIFESNRHALLNPAILPLGVDLTIPNVGR